MTALGQGPRLLTGATGFVGSHFLLRWALEGERVVALSRANLPGGATERVREALNVAARSLATPPPVPTVESVQGDLSRELCGVSPEARGRLRELGVRELWHFAASLQYEDKHRDAIFETNVAGTRRAIDLAQALGCEWFVHVSTAYTAGRRRGRISEQLPRRSEGFNNCYEASKADAEHLAAELCAVRGIKLAILRPSIVVGPSCSKSTGGSSTGIYGFARELARACGPLRALGRPLRLHGEPDTPLDLLPIDWFIEDVAELVRARVQAPCIHHHTLDASPTIHQVGEVLAELLELPGFLIEPLAAPSTPLEQLLARRTAFYAPYLRGGKQFQRARPSARRLSLEDLREYFAVCFAESRRVPRRDAGPTPVGSRRTAFR
jgi:nucleoside-diphosphate-sugar epimerase